MTDSKDQPMTDSKDQPMSDIQMVALIADLICEKRSQRGYHLSTLEKKILNLTTTHLIYSAEYSVAAIKQMQAVRQERLKKQKGVSNGIRGNRNKT